MSATTTSLMIGKMRVLKVALAGAIAASCAGAAASQSPLPLASGSSVLTVQRQIRSEPGVLQGQHIKALVTPSRAVTNKGWLRLTPSTRDPEKLEVSRLSASELNITATEASAASAEPAPPPGDRAPTGCRYVTREIDGDLSLWSCGSRTLVAKLQSGAPVEAIGSVDGSYAWIARKPIAPHLGGWVLTLLAEHPSNGSVSMAELIYKPAN